VREGKKNEETLGGGSQGEKGLWIRRSTQNSFDGVTIAYALVKLGAEQFPLKGAPKTGEKRKNQHYRVKERGPIKGFHIIRK